LVLVVGGKRSEKSVVLEVGSESGGGGGDLLSCLVGHARKKGRWGKKQKLEVSCLHNQLPILSSDDLVLSLELSEERGETPSFLVHRAK